MLRRMILGSLAVTAVLLAGVIPVSAQSIAPVQDYDDYDRAKIDRYLDVEVWTGHSDGEYYEGDNIVIYFRVNRDAFVSLYSIDTRGRVNLLFPSLPEEDNYVHGGVTYSLPGGEDDYDLEVSGPEGFENIQIIASRERFPIPDWYRGPELVADWEDRDDYMDWVNDNHFVRYGGQRFAYDRAVIYVNEWEETYFRPVYYPSYPSWTIYGNAYIDYPWGASIYVNGIYWGCAPLYLPRIAVGWHTISIYDHYGYCWEHDFHVSRYNTVVFNKTIIQTSPSVKSKYKEVRAVGYRNPVGHGYANYESRKTTMAAIVAKTSRKVTKGTGTKTTVGSETNFEAIPKKHVRGSTKIVKTERGYETDASTAIFPRKKSSRPGSTDRSRRSVIRGESGKSSKGSAGSDAGKTYLPTSNTKSGTSGSSGSVGRSSNKGKSGSTKSGRVGSSSKPSKKKTGGTARPAKKSGSSGKSTPKVEKRKSSGTTNTKTVEKKSKPSKPPKSSSSGNKKDGQSVKSTPSKKSSSPAKKANPPAKKKDDKKSKKSKKKK